MTITPTHEIVLRHASRLDYFTVRDLECLSLREAQIACQELRDTGTLIQVQKSEGSLPNVFASPQRLIQKCELAKLDVECDVTRKNLKA